MKIQCIRGANAGDKPSFGSPIEPGEEIFEGDIYTAIEEYQGVFKRCYKLKERPIPGLGYTIDRFIPLSEIDETTFERNYEKEKV